MKIINAFVAMLACVAVCLPAGQAQESPKSQASRIGPSVLPRTGPKAVNRVAISPDGRRFAATIRKDEGFYIYHSNMDGSDPQALPLMPNAEPYYLSWPTDDSLIAAYRKTRMGQRDRNANFQATSEKRFTSIVFVRSFNVLTEEDWILNEWDGGYWEVIPSLSSIGNIDTQAGKLSVDFGETVLSYDLGSKEITSADVETTYSYLENVLSADGNVRLSVRESNKFLLRCPDKKGNLKVRYTTLADRQKWPLQPVASGPGAGESYLLQRDEVGTLSRFVRFDCAQPDELVLIHDADGAVIEGVFFNLHQQTVIGLWTGGDEPGFFYLDERYPPQIAAVGQALGGGFDIWPVDFSRDGASYILYARTRDLEGGIFLNVQIRDGKLALSKLISEEALSR